MECKRKVNSSMGKGKRKGRESNDRERKGRERDGWYFSGSLKEEWPGEGRPEQGGPEERRLKLELWKKARPEKGRPEENKPEKRGRFCILTRARTRRPKVSAVFSSEVKMNLLLIFFFHSREGRRAVFRPCISRTGSVRPCVGRLVHRSVRRSVTLSSKQG